MNLARPALSVFSRRLADVEGWIQVAVLVVLLADPELEPLATDSIRRLADLGVTRVGIFRDGLGVAIALEGWAYDPAGSADATLDVVAADAKEVRTLVQVADVAVSKTDAQAQGRRAGSLRGPRGGEEHATR